MRRDERIKREINEQFKRLRMIDDAITGTMTKFDEVQEPYLHAIMRLSFERGKLYQLFEREINERKVQNERT